MAKAKWVLDKAHSEVNFTVRHMMIARVNGTFREFNAEIEFDPEDLTTADVKFTVDVASIDTRNEDRDNHLKSADFFDVEKYPELTFVAKEIVKMNDQEYEVKGELTMHGVTKPETFKVTYGGVAKDPFTGVEKAGISVSGKINRTDYGLTWNQALETGGVLVSEDVNIDVHLELTKE